MKEDNTKIILPHDHNENTIKLLRTKPDDDVFSVVSGTFGLISDSTRLKILWLLCHTEECVMNIAAAVGMSSPAVSHHLRILKGSGLITSKKIGKEAYYTLAKTEEADLVHKIVDSVFDMNCAD
ncbi:MAG: metalloregulator ArsR/SmtB family transcription factor [Anaerovoracaceae bacterium]|jgi:DNA-binding transcriptional ArsR family regulator|nr:metalloregulator ArsR/SmtB family transcription factor [Anaerovoracaceae bacterium]